MGYHVQLTRMTILNIVFKKYTRTYLKLITLSIEKKTGHMKLLQCKVVNYDREGIAYGIQGTSVNIIH